ncbi:Uncharacterised protein [Candidatus Tiddalikarchaeum anstoanum]|nr:Uncharacterised protein [Candidatus Tiddalikarchaeum anstoanum]
MANPKRVSRFVPAKNKDSIGVADKENQKFYKLDNAYLIVWQLCDGTKNTEQITKEFIKVLNENIKVPSKVDEKKLLIDVTKIVERLKKFGLVE